LEAVIEDFLNEKKQTWLATNLKNKPPEEESQIKHEGDEKFSLAKWLADNISKAKQLNMVTHNGKFTHPSAKISPLLAEGKRENDGFVRTGNCEVELDVYGNAAVIPVYRFLMLELSDGKKVIEHLEEESDLIKREFAVKDLEFAKIKSELLSIKKDEEPAVSSGLVKQVYFPVSDGYYLLSLLTPAGIMFELKRKIDAIRFSEEAKEARKRRRAGEYSEKGYEELYNLTEIGFGGTKPQNISIQNNDHRGRSYLLQSLPPVLNKRRVRLPRVNFFSNTLRYKNFEELFNTLHTLLAADLNNISIRRGRDKLLEMIFDQIVNESWKVRNLQTGWSFREYYKNLPIHQKIWLDDARLQERNTTAEWEKSIIDASARWIIQAYERILGDKAFKLGDQVLSHIKNIIKENREALK